MNTFIRFVATAAVAAAAMTGPVCFGASSASAAVPSAGGATSGTSVSAAPGPGACGNLDELAARADAHSQKANEYEKLRNEALMTVNPDPKKAAHYDERAQAHTRQAAEYRTKVKQCEAAERSNNR